MINIIEDWNVLVECAGEKFGFYHYQIDGGCIDLSVKNGNIGFRKEFENVNDPLLKKIMAFCKERGYIEIIENECDDQFFR